MRVANRSSPNKTVFDELESKVKMSRCSTHLILSSISQCARSVPFLFSFFLSSRTEPLSASIDELEHDVSTRDATNRVTHNGEVL